MIKLKGANMRKSEKTIYHLPENYYSIGVCEKMLECAHIIIGGTTGAGKSVLLDNFIYTILSKYTPHDAHIFFIDPKRVSFVKYKDLPHVEQLETDFKYIIQLLRDLVVTMDNRYKYMAQNNITQYTGKHIYIIIDEIASIMTDKSVKKDFEFLVGKIAMLGRASNIHLVCATQAPNRGVIPANLTVDFDGRIALRCNDAIESRQIIKRNGAETLPKHGKCIMLHCDGFYYNGFIPYMPDTIQETIKFWLKQGNNKKYFKSHTNDTLKRDPLHVGILELLRGGTITTYKKETRADVETLNILSIIDDD